ncbi:MAG: hypothetical protein HAW67_07325, partial [Endozoicomonadaceae bacterium]|nr:hypothetical protein [Endozoicomonadaceae bacterium]
MAVATTNNLRFAGDVYINSVSIQGYNGVNLDITNQIIGINIYESIFTPFISGSVIIEDTLDLANLYPLVGQELIHIDIDTPSLQIGNIRESFMLYKMTDRIPNGDKSNIYSLEFISVEAYVDINKKVSLPFSGNISEMAEKIIHSLNFGLESRKQSIIQKTKRNHKFISNHWSPVAMLNYLARQAVGEDNSTAFVFFENRDGFNFTSYEELSNGQVYQDFLFDKHTRDLAGVSSDIKNVQRDYTTILDIEFKSTYDYIEKIKKGMFSSKFTGYDLFNKQYIEKKYLISENGNDTKLNKYNPYTENAIFSNEALHKNYMFASNTFESIT